MGYRRWDTNVECIGIMLQFRSFDSNHVTHTSRHSKIVCTSRRIGGAVRSLAKVVVFLEGHDEEVSVWVGSGWAGFWELRTVGDWTRGRDFTVKLLQYIYLSASYVGEL